MQKELDVIEKLEKELYLKINGSRAINHYVKNFMGSIKMMIKCILEGIEIYSEEEIQKEYQEKITTLRLLNHRLNNPEIIKYLEEQYKLGNISSKYVDKILLNK